MPRRKTPMSLKYLCLQNVTSDVFWGSHPGLQEHPGFEHHSGPFEGIPSCLVSEIIGFMRYPSRLQTRHLRLLITSHLETLDISGCRDLNVVEEALSLASKRCSGSLQCLGLENCKLPPHVLINYLPYFAKLRTLYLGRTTCTDETLFAVGSFCPQLRVLDIGGNPGITMRGVHGLCIPKDGSGIENERFGRCRQLEKLDLGSLVASQDDIARMLESLPSLRQFEYQDRDTQFSYEYWATEKERTSWNRGLSWTPSPTPFKISVGPFLKTITLTDIPQLRDVDLQALCDVSELRALQIWCCESETSFTFENGILPVLKAQPHLEELNLHGIPLVNIKTVAGICKELRWLHCDGFDTGFTVDNLVKPFIPECLESIYLVNALRRSDLSFLLKSPRLTSVSLVDVESLTDDVLLKLAEDNCLTNLKTLEVRDCISLTAQGVKTLLKLETPLRRVVLIGCLSISDADQDVLVDITTKNNLDVEWEFD